jgi:hypothetical protein
MKNKKSLYALILVVVLTIPLTIQLAPSAQALQHFPAYLYVTAAPNPIGVGQTEYISLFFTKPIASPQAGGAFLGTTLVYYTGMTLNIVNPDGTNVTLGPYTADSTGGVGNIQFVPTVVGNYTVQAFFPGQTIVGTDIFIDPTMSPADTFTVQENPIPGVASAPLPTQYWTRPIYSTNYGWQNLGGNWWGLGRPAFMSTGGYDANGNFNPYTKAPTTAHVMWTKPTQFGGQVGGPIPSNQESQYTSTSILYHQFEPVILNGIIFYNWYPNVPTAVAGIQAVDLRTGTTLWHLNTTDILAFGQVLKFHTVQEYGSQSWLWALSSDNSKLNLYDPLSGTYVASVTNLPSGFIGLFGGTPSGMYDGNEPNEVGSILFYYINSTNAVPGNPFSPVVASSLTMWNSSLMMTPDPTSFFASTIRPSGNINFSLGIQWSVPIPLTYNGAAINPALGISAITDKAILLTSYPGLLPTFAVQWGGPSALEMAFDAKTGQLKWGPTNQTLITYHELDLMAAGEGYYVRHDKDTNQLYGYSLDTGQRLWGPVQLPGNALSTIESSGAIAYGKVYVWDFGGYVNAVYLNNGTIAWTFSRGSAGYNTPYGIYPIWGFGSQSIADGMIFLSESRMYDPPLFPNARKLALNCTDGSLVWSVLGFYGRDTSAIADGYIAAWNSYDGQIYAFGVGPTRTTVSAPSVGVTTSTAITISGTVADISSGSLQNAVAANFPNGLPCVSDDSMAAWMEYVYMQQPMPTNLTGVPVTVAVTDSNGNCYDIGTVVTNPSGFYSLSWTPIIPGNFTVTATFAGTQSYYGSYANAAFSTNEAVPTAAPTAVPIANYATTSDLMMYMVGGVIAMIIAIAIVGLLILRKKP